MASPLRARGGPTAFLKWSQNKFEGRIVNFWPSTRVPGARADLPPSFQETLLQIFLQTPKNLMTESLTAHGNFQALNILRPWKIPGVGKLNTL